MLAFRDDLLDGQLLRTVGHASYGGAEIGECLAAAKATDPRDRDSWMRVWLELADRTFAEADACRDAIGTRRGFLAPSACAKAGSHSATVAGSSSTTL